MATVTSVTDSKRGCGWRKPGGMYLMSDGLGMSCNLLPYHLDVCPTCGHGIKPTRGGWTWVKPDPVMPHHSDPDTSRRHPGCPLNDPGLLGEKAGLMWIGGTFYPTPEAWLAEGKEMGFSRRVTGVPRGLVVGETWIMTAHRKVSFGVEEIDGEQVPVVKPAVFHLWQPSRIEYVVKGDEGDERLEYLESRGLTLVRVVHDQTDINDDPSDLDEEEYGHDNDTG